MRLGFTQDAAAYIVNNQGLDAEAEFRVLEDDDVEQVCKVTRPPGGTIDDGAGNEVPNPGIPISLRAELNLKTACYWMRFRQRTSRTTDAADIQLAAVRNIREHRKWEKTHENVEAPTIDAKDWPKTIESIREYLRGTLGDTKNPLAYVIRAEIPIQADPEDGYPSKLDELIARAPIRVGENFTATYQADNLKVWELLSALTRAHECWTYVKANGAQTSRNGCQAFYNLKDHYLGRSMVDNQSSAAENKLKTTTYSGEKKRWNFDKFVRIHLEQHAVLEGLTEHGYAGIDPRSKVRHLLSGIKTSDLDSVKTQIMASQELRGDFDRCVNLFKDFIEQQEAMRNAQSVTIAAVNTEHEEEGSVKPDMSVEDRYYSKQEYLKLSAPQRLALRLKRKKRGGGQGGNKGKRMDLSKRTIKALATALRKDNDASGGTSDTSDSEEEAPKRQKTKTNRKNKSLSRKK